MIIGLKFDASSTKLVVTGRPFHYQTPFSLKMIVGLRTVFLLIFLWANQIRDSSSGNVRYVDYDFPDADDLFANRTFPTFRRESPVAPTQDPNCTYPPPFTLPAVDGTTSTPHMYTASDSPIGYEVPCGIRGGNNSTVYNLDINGHRIVGGIKAHPGEFPWQVSLQLISGWFSRHICGGAILSSYWVVTAGHCVAHLKPKAIVVVAGDHDLFKPEGTEQVVNVVRIVNAGYSPENFSSDLALLQLSPPLKLDGKQVAPICLPNPTKKYQPGEFGIVSGWGKLSEGGKMPHILHFVRLPIISVDHCHKLYENINYGKYMNKCQLCCGYDRGGSDSCQGDSGGPLICQHPDKRYYLCGIVSWGVGCARPKLPGVYTEVPCYSSWIKSILYNVDNLVSEMPPYN